MNIFVSSEELVWGELDIPLFGHNEDWFSNPVVPPVAFSLARDPKSLWFIASYQSLPTIHPLTQPHQFTPELWKYDCAELFISSHGSADYLEFNLAPNGAWWAAKFQSPRNSYPNQPDFNCRIRTWHEITDGSWIAAMAIDVGLLEKEIGFPDQCKINSTFILKSPRQTFVSVTKLPGTSPDFHQPSYFSIPRYLAMP